MIASFFKISLHGFGWLLLAGFCLLLSGFIGQYFFKEGVMLAKSQQLRQHEILLMSEALNKPEVVQCIKTLFSNVPLTEWQVILASNEAFSQHKFKPYVEKMPRLKGFLRGAILQFQMTQAIFANLLVCFILRLILVFLFLPLILLFAFVGLVDGLTQRHLRKLQGARESSVLYQRCREGLTASFFVSMVLYIGLPISMNAMIGFLTLAVFLGVLFSMTARTYKKYL